MALLSAFYPYIKPYCSGASEPAINRALIDAADDFCRRSRAIRLTADPVQLIPGIRDYELSADAPNAYADTALSVEVEIDGKARWLDPARPHQRAVAAEGAPEAFFMVASEPGTVRIWPTPNIAAIATVEVATRPTMTARTLDDRLLQDWRTPLAAGALARLFLTPNLPYSSPEAAGAYQGIFEDGVREAYTRAAQGGVKTVLRTQVQRA